MIKKRTMYWFSYVVMLTILFQGVAFASGCVGKTVNGKCVRDIVKCTSWISENECGTCEKGYHPQWYGKVAKICFPDQSTANKICGYKKPNCKYASGQGWAADDYRGFPWLDCGDNADNVWWFYYSNGYWVPNGKKGNPGC